MRKPASQSPWLEEPEHSDVGSRHSCIHGRAGISMSATRPLVRAETVHARVPRAHRSLLTIGPEQRRPPALSWLLKWRTSSSDLPTAARSCSPSRKQSPSRQAIDDPVPPPTRADAIAAHHCSPRSAIELATGFGDKRGDSPLTRGRVLCPISTRHLGGGSAIPIGDTGMGADPAPRAPEDSRPGSNSPRPRTFGRCARDRRRPATRACSP